MDLESFQYRGSSNKLFINSSNTHRPNCLTGYVINVNENSVLTGRYDVDCRSAGLCLKEVPVSQQFGRNGIMIKSYPLVEGTFVRVHFSSMGFNPVIVEILPIEGNEQNGITNPRGIADKTIIREQGIINTLMDSVGVNIGNDAYPVSIKFSGNGNDFGLYKFKASHMGRGVNVTTGNSKSKAEMAIENVVQEYNSALTLIYANAEKTYQFVDNKIISTVKNANTTNILSRIYGLAVTDKARLTEEEKSKLTKEQQADLLARRQAANQKVVSTADSAMAFILDEANFGIISQSLNSMLGKSNQGLAGVTSKLNPVFTDIQNVMLKSLNVLNKAVKVGEAVEKTMVWLNEGGLGPWINNLVETYGTVELDLGIINLSLTPGLTSFSGWLDFDTGVPLLDKYIEAQTNKFAQKILSKINFGKFTGIINSAIGEYKGPPAGVSLLPASLTLTLSPQKKDSNSNSKKLKNLQKELQQVGNKFQEYREGLKKPKYIDSGLSVGDYPVNDTVNAGFDEEETAYPYIYVARELNNLNFIEYPHHELASYLTMLGVEQGGAISTYLDLFVEKQSIFDLIKVLTIIADPFTTLKLAIGYAYISSDSDIALELIKNFSNKYIVEDCSIFNSITEQLLSDATAENLEAVNSKLINYYYDDLPFRYNKWLESPDYILEDLQFTSIYRAAELLIDGKLSEFTAETIKLVTKSDIRLYPSRYLILNDIINKSFSPLIMSFQNE